MDAVQDAIEKLAQLLHRSIAVDDADLRLIASSTHFDDADAVRLQSLVGRRVEGAARDYVFGSGVRLWRVPAQLPANPSIGADMARVCFPLWSRYELLGFMWVMEATPLTEEEFASCSACAVVVRDLLARKAQREAEDTREIESLAFGLLSTAAGEREAAAADLLELRLFREASMFTAVAATVDDGFDTHEEAPSSLIRRAFAYIQQSRFARMTAAGLSEDVAILVIGHRTILGNDELYDVCDRIMSELTRLSPVLASHVTLGVGAAQPRLDTVAISYDQALEAARSAFRRGPRVGVWGEDPLVALLSASIQPRIERNMLPGVLAQIEEQMPETIPLLQAFLDKAGNVVRTSEALHLHRTSVYYRLGKFQESTGLDLDDGEVRLMLHLWVRTRDRVSSHSQER